MKFRTLVVLALAAAVPALACAKKPKKVETEAPAEAQAVVEEEPAITGVADCAIASVVHIAAAREIRIFFILKKFVLVILFCCLLCW